MFIKAVENFEKISNFELFLDNNITYKDFENGTLKTFNLDYKETILTLNNIITINLYQYNDIYLNKTNYYLICDKENKTYKLYKEN